MEFRARVSFIRITSRKVGLIADQVRGKGLNEAINLLHFSPRKRTAGIISTLIKSAAANATQKGTVDADQLYVKTLLVGTGPILKRWGTRAKGAGTRINKRTSHITVTLAER